MDPERSPRGAKKGEDTPAPREEDTAEAGVHAEYGVDTTNDSWPNAPGMGGVERTQTEALPELQNPADTEIENSGLLLEGTEHVCQAGIDTSLQQSEGTSREGPFALKGRPATKPAPSEVLKVMKEEREQQRKKFRLHSATPPSSGDEWQPDDYSCLEYESDDDPCLMWRPDPSVGEEQDIYIGNVNELAPQEKKRKFDETGQKHTNSGTKRKRVWCRQRPTKDDIAKMLQKRRDKKQNCGQQGDKAGAVQGETGNVGEQGEAGPKTDMQAGKALAEVAPADPHIEEGGGHAPNSREKAGKKYARKRPKKQRRCPLKGCPRAVVNMRRHFSLYHHMTKEEASQQYFASVHIIHKQKRNDYEQCPNCVSKVKHLAHHLARHCKGGTSTWKEAVMLARRVGQAAVLREGIDDESDDFEISTGEESEVEEDVQAEDCKAELQITLDDFEKWLPSVDGSTRSKTTARHYREYMRKIALLACCGDLKQLINYKDFAKPGGLWDKLLENLSPSTVTTYMHALAAFFQFLSSNQDTHWYMDEDKCSDAIDRCGKWAKSLKSHRAVQRHVHQDAEEERIPQVAEVMKQYANSQHHRDAEFEIATKLTSRDPIDVKTLLRTRNYLIIKLLLRNGQRTGTIINSTMREYRNILKVDDHYIMKVFKHKTVASFGPAKLVIDKDLKDQLDVWVTAKSAFLAKAGLSRVVLSDGAPLFSNQFGQELRSNEVSRFLSLIFKKQGAELPWDGTAVTKFTPTQMRKAQYLIASQQQGGQSMENLDAHARHATHSLDTARRLYDARSKNKLSVQASARMKEAVECSEKVSKPDAGDGHFTAILDASGKVVGQKKSTAPAALAAPLDAMQKTAAEAMLNPAPEETPEAPDQEDAVANETLSQDNVTARVAQELITETASEVSSQRSHARRAGYTKTEEDLLRRAFSENIERGVIPMSTIKHALKNEPELADIAIKWTPQQIRDKIRSVIRTQEKRRKRKSEGTPEADQQY